MTTDCYEIRAIRYARHARRSPENFIGGDPHDVEMPLDYYVWVISNASRSLVVDTGFGDAMAAKRGRRIVEPVAKGLMALGLAAERIDEVIITHMHYDHAGNIPLFPRARFHLQDKEMEFATGRCMCHDLLSHGYEADDVVNLVRCVFDRRVEYHDGAAEIAPGVEVHHLGGHTKGLQAVRVRTERGWVVLASDASHFYAHLEQDRAFPVLYNLGDMLAGYKTLRRLASSPQHIVPGHDPLVMQRYPAAGTGLEDWIVRLDVEPTS
ncbi:MAG: N-acyl homoserine lactonase family protein [Gammaproteobacteria bacterium]|nr:N-acyl homoserine lactonase family protein [Gammaproteobacteria bacterium]MBI5616472.1 N-acyl homoserine lactonase family protein [Gammaproteobacteria bacterium]